MARFADGSAIEADVVIGADGIHSVVRKACRRRRRASPAASVARHGADGRRAGRRRRQRQPDVDGAARPCRALPVQAASSSTSSPISTATPGPGILDAQCDDAEVTRPTPWHRDLPASIRADPLVQWALYDRDRCRAGAAAPRCLAIRPTPCCPISARRGIALKTLRARGAVARSGRS